jgi:hypothetical protein
MCGPPDLEGERAARPGSPNRITDFKKPDQNCTSLADIQASRLSRLYALSLSTASTIASLAFSVSR